MNSSKDMATFGNRRRTTAGERRLSETRRVKWQDHTAYVTVGYDDSGRRPVEIFYNAGHRRGSEMDVLISDICIALSVMLRHEEMTAEHLENSMSIAFDVKTGRREPASVLGLLLREIMRPPAWLPGDWANQPIAEAFPESRQAPSKAAPSDERGAGEPGADECGPGYGHQTASAAPDGVAILSRPPTGNETGERRDPS